MNEFKSKSRLIDSEVIQDELIQVFFKIKSEVI